MSTKAPEVTVTYRDENGKGWVRDGTETEVELVAEIERLRESRDRLVESVKDRRYWSQHLFSVRHLCYIENPEFCSAAGMCPTCTPGEPEFDGRGVIPQGEPE